MKWFGANLLLQRLRFVSNGSMMTRLLYLLLLSIVLAFGCQQDLGEQLFEINYPPLDFTLPPGQPPFQAFVLAQSNMTSRFEDALNNNNISADEVDEVSGLFARITSLSGEDFGQLEGVDLRLCPVGQTNGCSEFDILFSIDNLYRRREVVINLNPGLRNFKELFESDRFDMELVFFSGETTNQSIDCRLEWSVRGVNR